MMMGLIHISLHYLESYQQLSAVFQLIQTCSFQLYKCVFIQTEENTGTRILRWKEVAANLGKQELSSLKGFVYLEE